MSLDGYILLVKSKDFIPVHSNCFILWFLLLTHSSHIVLRSISSCEHEAPWLKVRDTQSEYPSKGLDCFQVFLKKNEDVGVLY
jgi:hypothetical protein